VIVSQLTNGERGVVVIGSDFLTGFVAGFIAAGLLGYSAAQARAARKKILAFENPQNVSHKTNQTPLQILRGCLAGFVNFVIWTVVFAAVFALFALLILRALELV
jgi:hypothetical protein